MSKTVGGPPSILERLQAASDRPLSQRCQLMEDILKTLSSKDLRPLFPMLLHEIFDFDRSQYSGWRLDTVKHSSNPDLFARIMNLLGPEGLMMKLVHTLQGDSYAQYEFPITYLPAPVRNMIAEGAVPPFYANKLQLQGSSASVLILTAFELYIFHLAYALVSPSWQVRNESWPSLLDYAYPAVVDAMFLHFFPCDKKSLPSSPQFNASPVRQQGIISHANSLPTAMTHSSYQMSPNSMGSQRTLFKSSFINAQRQHQISLSHMEQPETETQQSETFLQILTEFWLNQNSGPGIESHLSSSFQEHFLPSLGQVKLVRLVVKHIHHFANSATVTVTSSYQQTVCSPLDQFKRMVISCFLQKKLYAFLRHAFERWPLDSCFRMVLETWLSYIQPWRYVDSSQEPRGSDTDLHRQVDDKWDSFVEDNLLFYSVLMAEFLPRTHRMDLTSPYSAYMVYRVARIFSLPGLSNLIHKAEQETFGLSSRIDLGESYLSSRSQISNVTVPSLVVDFEGPNFQCPLFFSDAMRRNIDLVIHELRQALVKVRLQQEEARNTKKSRGFLASIFGVGGDTQKLESSPEFKQLPSHLETAIVNFCNIFAIPVPPFVVAPPVPSSSPSSTSCASQTNSATSLDSSVANDSMYLTDGDKRRPHCLHTEHGLQLSPIGRSQLLNRECRFDSFDTGDPDLQPVRSYENGMLVRLLFHLCCFINLQFESQFSSLFYRKDMAGQFSRSFLTAPMSPSQTHPQSPSKPASQRYSDQSFRPRISLRFLASYHTLMHVAIVYFLCSIVLATGPLGFLFVTAAMLFFYGVLSAVLRHFSNKDAVEVR